jgi:hypothetical protein
MCVALLLGDHAISIGIKAIEMSRRAPLAAVELKRSTLEG